MARDKYKFQIEDILNGLYIIPTLEKIISYKKGKFNIANNFGR